MESLKISCNQLASDGSVLSNTTVDYPGSLPNEEANLLNLTSTLHITLVALRAALGKAVVTGGDPMVIAEMARLESGLSALIGTSVSQAVPAPSGRK